MIIHDFKESYNLKEHFKFLIINKVCILKNININIKNYEIVTWLKAKLMIIAIVIIFANSIADFLNYIKLMKT